MNIDYIISNLRDYENPKDIEVLITLSESSVGSRAFAKVKYVGMGFDWENGQLRIESEKPIVSKGNNLGNIKKVECQQYDGRNHYFCARCESKISKEDKYCRYCSQTLK